jgi:thymidylate kinase
MLPGPKINEVKIWFQGSTGAGKTLLADLVREVLKAKGLTVRRYVFGEPDYVAPRERYVDLTDQSIDDVITVEIDVDGIHKLLKREAV